MVLAMGPAGRYLIMALIFLVILGGGTYLAYQTARRRASNDARAHGRADGGGDAGHSAP
jgi:hypothetical protein